MNMLFILFIVGLILGFMIGFWAFGMYIGYSYYAGMLKKMESDEGDPYLYLDLDKHPNEIGNRQYVLFKVDFYKPKTQK